MSKQDFPHLYCESKTPKCWLTICANLKPFCKVKPKVSKRQEEDVYHAKGEVRKLTKSKLWKGSYEVQQQQKERQKHTKKKKDNEMSLLLDVMKKVESSRPMKQNGNPTPKTSPKDIFYLNNWKVVWSNFFIIRDFLWHEIEVVEFIVFLLQVCWS